MIILPDLAVYFFWGAIGGLTGGLLGLAKSKSTARIGILVGIGIATIVTQLLLANQPDPFYP